MFKIVSSGSYLPPLSVSNHDLSSVVDTSDDWIYQRTGIRCRRYSQGEKTSDLAAKALISAMQKKSISPEEIDVIILATTTPDISFPSTACLVQGIVKATNAFAFDLNAVCSGFVYAMTIANGIFYSMQNVNRIAVIGADLMTSVLNMNDRSTCVLFGDGAGALILERTISDSGIISSSLSSNGMKNSLYSDNHGLKMNGSDVFKYATSHISSSLMSALSICGKNPEDLSALFVHQANKRIIEFISKSLSISIDKIPLNIDRYGNTSAASIPILFDEVISDNKRHNFNIVNGSLVSFSSAGSGMTSGSIIVRI